MASYSDLSINQLQLLRNSGVGDVARSHIDAELAAREAATPGIITGKQSGNNPDVEAKSTDPRDKMTSVEKRMADVMDIRKRLGDVVDWWFENITFRTGAGRTYYRPDFVAMLPNGSIEVTEVKGKHIWDDARDRFKSAALMYPFARWRMLKWEDDDWRTVYDFKARGD